LSETSQKPEEITPEKPVKWFSMKDRFFTSAIIAEKSMKKTYFASEVNPDDSSTVKYLRANAEFPIENQTVAMQYFFGPNDYDVVSEITDGFQENVYLGWPVIAPLTRFVVIPLFNLFEKISNNYGVVIIIMVLFVRMLMSPLTYKAYLSQAKMKVLQPELNAIKEKHGEDMTAASQEQMKLYGQVGINPLSGCIPLVLQMPIFLALFTFFPNAIQLRGQSFLWAHDLSTFDSILDLPFNIPFLGAHISLFTLLMSVTQIGISQYSMQTTTQPANSPINMKVLIYMMPFMFFFMLNSYPAGLTMYYFISNVITIAQNAAIRKFFVDDDKLRAALNKNRERNTTNPPKKSSFQKRLEDVMKAQQETKDKKDGKDKDDKKK
jgi:YidC/Oxa1 family membrane protein insertase